ncbi:hypothetical protein JHW43_002027 [Diplocarpon mali]|nr:hypothetical protein JHW43_002027 [Diplocarpon mali]
MTRKYHRIAGKPVNNILAKKESSPENMLSVFMSRGLTATYLVSEALIGIIAGAHNSHSHAQHTHPHHGTRTPEPGFHATPHKDVIRGLDELPYLQHVVREGMRLWTLVASLLFKVPPPAGNSAASISTARGLPRGSHT